LAQAVSILVWPLIGSMTSAGSQDPVTSQQCPDDLAKAVSKQLPRGLPASPIHLCTIALSPQTGWFLRNMAPLLFKVRLGAVGKADALVGSAALTGHTRTLTADQAALILWKELEGIRHSMNRRKRITHHEACTACGTPSREVIVRAYRVHGPAKR
jgi:hypothetical protein